MALDLSTVTEVIARVGGLANVGADQDIYDAGVSSVDALKLLLELESEFGVEIPDQDFVSARTPRAMLEMMMRLGGAVA